MSTPLETPVVLIVFRRPEVTRRNIEALRAVKPRQLFVVSDGPRPGRDEEAAKVVETQALISELVDWECDLQTKYAERNIGLEANVELGLDWVFSQVDRAIVLEDDCIADPSFFAYCAELLTRYEDEKRVWLIAGDNKGVPRELFDGKSYGFTSWASVWGWASWADRWHAHRANFPRTHEGAEDRVDATPRTADAVRITPSIPAEGSLLTEAAVRHFTFVQGETDGDRYGWDHHYWCTIMSEGGLCASPAYNMIENDGYGEGSTHMVANKEPVPAEEMPFPLVHPDEVALDPKVETELELILLRIDGRLSRLVRKLIKPLWLRAIIRKIITQPLVWRVVRKVVAR